MNLLKTHIVTLSLLLFFNVSYSQEVEGQDGQALSVKSLEGVQSTTQKVVTQTELNEAVLSSSSSSALSSSSSSALSSFSSSALTSSSSNSTEFDVGVPADSPFKIGGDVTGIAQNTVNEITGKLSFSVPLASVSSASLGYSLGLSYNGQASFKQGCELNKYNPSSVLGVGWSISRPRIVVNNKQTATFEDDEFYFVDGNTNSKLILIEKVSDNEWKYRLEKYKNWQITFYHTYSQTSDVTNWVITKDDGTTYFYGNVWGYDANEYQSVWGNWIGSSVQNPTNHFPIVWNLNRISDQWGNYIRFRYDFQEGKQNLNVAPKYNHTEASYLTDIISSKGNKIVLNYGDKGVKEYFEPHTEVAEPDAYQERYEKRFLQSVSIYNTKNALVKSYTLGYDVIQNLTNDFKRYLKSITQSSHKGSNSESLPPQLFDYYTSGTFKGGLEKITYPSGGSVRYNYNNKYLFYNGSNKFVTIPDWSPDGYTLYSTVVKDNYTLSFSRTTNPVTGDKHRFIIYTSWWNGQKWERKEFLFPHAIEDHYPNSSGDRLKDFYVVTGDDFYGLLYKYSDNRAYHYLFHKNREDNGWDEYVDNSTLALGEGNPSYMFGNDFVAIGEHRNGNLRTYTWYGDTWSSFNISQGGGQYYYAARNNFIISLDEDGGPDKVTGVSYDDNYYIHYLDAKKNWQTKSWSAFATPRIHSIEKPSNFFPDNSIAGFVADDNRELFLRWDVNYNLIAVDDVIGAWNDTISIQPDGNGMFSLVFQWWKEINRSARFNGVSWNVWDYAKEGRYVNFGLDFVSYYENDSDYLMYRQYSPNSNKWVGANLNWCPWYTNYNVNGVNQEYMIARNKIFKRSTSEAASNSTLDQIATLDYDNYFTITDGVSHAYVKQVEWIDNGGSAYNEFKKGTYFYINKETGALNSIDLGLKYNLRGTKKIAGYNSFMSRNSIWLRLDSTIRDDEYYVNAHRIINDKVNNSIYDIVVDNMQLYDANGNNRKIQYVYNDSKTLPDNSVTYYGEVIKENKGFGTGNIGKIKKVFNNGSQDIQKLGLLEEEYVYHADGTLKSKNTNTWEKKELTGGTFYRSYYNLLTSKIEELYFESGSFRKETEYDYITSTSADAITGLLESVVTKDSKGKDEKVFYDYAYDKGFVNANFRFMEGANMLTSKYQTITYVGNEVVDVKRNIWVEEDGKIYLKEKWSGPNESNLRLNAEVTHVDSDGNVLEVTDGMGEISAVLNAYNNLFEVANIRNATYTDVMNALDVNDSQLQNLDTEELKVELLKLYDRLPQAMISLTFYDDNGRVINQVDNRKEESYIYYDIHGRLDYVTDGDGNVLSKKEYNFAN